MAADVRASCTIRREQRGFVRDVAFAADERRPQDARAGTLRRAVRRL
jgi:hypothetical protein